jgi:acetyltransferase-like isoleucine patch superfamily enzyme
MRPRARGLLQRAAAYAEHVYRDVRDIRSGDPLARGFAEFGVRSVVAGPIGNLGNVASVAIGDDVYIRAGGYFEALAPPGHVVLRFGDRIHVGYNVRFVAVNGIEVGDECGLGHGATFADTIHEYKTVDEDEASWQAGLKLGRPLKIGRGVWVGNNCVVTGGITIGDRAIIGPNCVINRDVPPDTLVAGAPAKVQRRRLASGEWEWLVDPASVELEIRAIADERQG